MTKGIIALTLQMFSANTDSNTIKRIDIPLPVVASRIMIIPVGKNNNVGLRLELYGCDPGLYIAFVLYTIRRTRTYVIVYIFVQSLKACHSY